MSSAVPLQNKAVTFHEHTLSFYFIFKGKLTPPQAGHLGTSFWMNKSGGRKVEILIAYVCAQSSQTLSLSPRTVAHQASLCNEFSKEKYWNEWPFPSPGDLPDPGIIPACLASPALTSRFFTTELCRVKL